MEKSSKCFCPCVYASVRNSLNQSCSDNSSRIMAKLTVVVLGAFILFFVVPLMVVIGMAGPAGILFDLFLGALLVFFIPLFIKIDEETERSMKIRKIEEAKQQNRMSQLCGNLTKLSSIVIKCPRCQWTFLRTDQTNWSLSKQLGQTSYPTSFNCPHCRVIIVRSREPSAFCKAFGERVSGERLFNCTFNRCTG